MSSSGAATPPVPKKAKAKGVIWSQTSTRTIVQYVDSVKGVDSPFLGKGSSLRNELSAIKDIIDQDFQPPSVPITEAKIRDKLSQIWHDCKVNKHEDLKVFWEYATSRMDMDKLDEKFLAGAGVEGEVFTMTGTDVSALGSLAGTKRSRDEAFEPTSAGMSTVKKAKSAKAKSVVADNGNQDAITAEWEAAAVQDQFIIQSGKDAANALETSVVRVGEKIFPQDVKADMKVLHGLVNDAVGNVLDGMEFPEDQPPALNTSIFFSEEVAKLLAGMMGTTGRDWLETKLLLNRLLAVQTADQLSLNVFIQSFVGVYIQKYVFNLAGFRENDEFTKEELYTQFPEGAKRMANHFDQLVGQILPNRRLSPSSHDLHGLFDPKYEKITTPTVKEQGSFWRSKPLGQNEEPIRPLITLPYQVTWLKELEGVFNLATQFRANLAMMKEYEFTFEFPAFMDPHGQKDPNRVLLGLLPTIKVTPIAGGS